MTRAAPVVTLGVAALLGAWRGAPPARAAPPVDPDAAAEATSAFWDEVSRPGTRALHARVADAVRTLRLSNADLTAVERDLTRLTADAPALADAWGYLAITSERRRRWAACADAYARAFALAPAWRPEALIDARTLPRSPLLRAPALSLALCQTRAGRFADARRVVERAIAVGDTSPELWLRAGEVAMAEGRLADAIDALGRSTESAAAWLLALALDRAGRDAEADAAADRAHQLDPYAARTAGATVPMAPPEDADALLALAARQREQWGVAVVYLRRYLAMLPAASPWRARAAATLAIVDAAAVTERPAVQTSTGLDDVPPELYHAVAAAAPQLAACMTPVATGLAELRITVATPPRPLTRPVPRPAPPRPGARPVPRFPVPRGPTPPLSPARPGVSAYYLLAPDDAVGDDARDLALRCLETVGLTVRLPAPPPGGWTTVRVPVHAVTRR